MRASFFYLGYPQWSLFLEYPAKECIMMAGHGRSGMMMRTFASIRDDEGLRESGCHVRHVLMSPPNNTPSEHETVRGLFPLAVTLAIRHATAIVLSQMPMARVPRLPSTDYWLIHVPLKPSPLPPSLAMDFCHVVSLHGSYGTGVSPMAD